MAVSESDVLKVASLARLTIEPARLSALVSELNGILGHMEVLQRVETGGGLWDAGDPGSTTAMRSDAAETPIPLVIPREAFAPELRDGFFLVPRLATHDDRGADAP